MIVVLTSCSNRHSRLTEIYTDPNFEYRQKRQPSAQEVRDGEYALSIWKKTDKYSRNRIAEDIVLGKNLVGMDVTTVISKLGPPWDQDSIRNPEQQRPFGYYASGGESQCNLRLDIDSNGIVRDSFLDVNN